MNKKELVARIAQSTGLPQVQVARALDSTIHLIKEELIASGAATRALDSTIDLIDPALVEAGKKSKCALDSTINMVPDSVVDTGKVKILGLGTFYTVKRKARVGRNPRTGDEVRIKAKTVPKFKPSQTLIDRINE